jgi:hypothetical protein
MKDVSCSRSRFKRAFQGKGKNLALSQENKLLAQQNHLLMQQTQSLEKALQNMYEFQQVAPMPFGLNMEKQLKRLDQPSWQKILDGPPGLQKHAEEADAGESVARFKKTSSDHSTCSTADERSPSDSTNSDAESSGTIEHASPQGPRTTIVIKNAMPECTREMLLSFLNAVGFEDTYDMVYLPMCFETKRCHQFAFVNFLAEEIALKFMSHLQGVAVKVFSGEQRCEIVWSDCQGLKANIENYRNSPVMHKSVPQECKPQLFVGGHPVPFPAPTKKIIKPRRNRRER